MYFAGDTLFPYGKHPCIIKRSGMFISAVMSRAEKEGRVVFNPCKKVDAPKKEQHRVEILQPDEVERMLNLLESEPLK